MLDILFAMKTDGFKNFVFNLSRPPFIRSRKSNEYYENKTKQKNTKPPNYLPESQNNERYEEVNIMTPTSLLTLTDHLSLENVS